jgi:hypothetical protein
MASLSVLNASGDTTVTWNEDAYAVGDATAAAAVAEAERLFAEARAAGGEAFRVQAGALAERVTTLRPGIAEDVMIVPRMVGG